uniref:Uncharacterized protein n=1 Tax=Cyprinus carpio TaxID=7962 RepID=A0A8C1NG83_CYPCA
MSNTSLTEIPEDTPTNITGWILSNKSLVMSASDINTLQKYLRIKMLDLSYNLIQTLPPGAFDKLINLEILTLRANSLQTLDKDIFKGVRNLKSLDLKDNPLNSTTVKTSLEKSTATTLNTRSTSTTGHTVEPSNSSHVNSSSKGKHTRSNTPDCTLQSMCFSSGLMARDGETPTGSHSWKFLLGVVALTLSTSMLIVCAHSVLDTGLSLQPFEDEDDGFIEDGYIEPGNYREHGFLEDQNIKKIHEI